MKEEPLSPTEMMERLAPKRLATSKSKLTALDSSSALEDEVVTLDDSTSSPMASKPKPLKKTAPKKLELPNPDLVSLQEDFDLAT